MKAPFEFVDLLDAETKQWMDAAARGDAPWVCSDCGATCPNGMPVDCVYGHQRCTDILTRDRERAERRRTAPEDVVDGSRSEG